MTEDQHADDDLWVAAGTPDQPEDHAELPLVATDGRPARRSPWVLVGGVAVLVVALLGGAWALAGRGGDDSVTKADAPAGAEGFWGQRWQVRSITGKGAPDLGSGAAVPELFLDSTIADRISFTGCNGASGPATVEGGRLVVGPEGFAQTDMACIAETGPDLMAFDTWMQELLRSEPTITVSGSRLTLTSDLGTVILRQAGGPTTTIPNGDLPDGPVTNDPASDDPSYLPDPGSGSSIIPGPTVVPGDGSGGGVGAAPANTGADDAVGQDWEVTGLTVDGRARSLLADRDGGPVVLDLTQDGLVGFNGCNGAGGAVRIDGDRLVVSGLNSTKVACTGPDGEALVAQDSAIAALLEADPTASVEGSTLTLSTSKATLTATRLG